jgi:DNA-binding transcriptional regulator LsrR (DeoR family)
MRVVRQRLSDAAIALVGIGTLGNSVFLERGVLTSDDAEELAEAGAVGEICGRFFDAKGNECDTPWRDRAMSIEVEQLRGIPLVLGVVSGSDRSDAILAAIRGRLIKGLVIDEAGATVLLAVASSAAAAKTKKRKR